MRGQAAATARSGGSSSSNSKRGRRTLNDMAVRWKEGNARASDGMRKRIFERRMTARRCGCAEEWLRWSCGRVEWTTVVVWNAT
ncbi:hypothetical protein DEO72_LG5g1002 [Vigna unguiculata]|uniref:Uncharacterized protein n=1 Tax=Vigna unguiculata TaxID=3917 RepID=A0A4D6LWS8_VIGUN|nr:hypothetical protein DEO72_LG5g1002 [Vigna unguiculata]